MTEVIPPAQDGVRLRGRNSAGKTVIKGHAEWQETKDGPLKGTMAWVVQLVDRIASRYKKRVTLSDGTLAKNVDRPLTDQSAHGPQRRP